jgi:hypothetical protein
MANQANLEATLAAIESHPDHWDQSSWHCGTSHCFAGFAEMLRLGRSPVEKCSEAGEARIQAKPGDSVLIDFVATRLWLGLDRFEFDEICAGENTLEDIRHCVTLFCKD